MSPSAIPSRITAIDAGRVLPAIGLVATPLAIFAPLGMAPLFILAAVLVAAADWRRARDALSDVNAFSLLLLVLCLWGALSALWSIIPGHTLIEAVRFMLEGIGGLILVRAAARLSPAERKRLLWALLAGLVMAMLLLAVERVTRGALTHWFDGIPAGKKVNLSRFDRGVTVTALVFWVVAAGFGARRFWWTLLLLLPVTLLVILDLNSRAAMLATLISLPIFALAWAWPRLIAAVLVVILLLGGTALPEFTPDQAAILRLQHWNHHFNDQSYFHRLGIWHFASERIAERPWFGWGMDASRAIPGGQQEMSELMPEIHWRPPAQALPLHPHNAPIQWRLELGIFGLLITVCLLGSLFWRAANAPFDRFRRAGTMALISSGVVIALFAYGTWQSWWICALWLVAACFTGVVPPTQERA